MVTLEPGKYYDCSVCGSVYKRSEKAKRPYLPCGHFPEHIREITKEHYLELKSGKEVSPQGSLTSHNPEPKTDHERMKEMEFKLCLLDHNVVSLKIQIKFIADILRKDLP